MSVPRLDSYQFRQLLRQRALGRRASFGHCYGSLKAPWLRERDLRHGLVHVMAGELDRHDLRVEDENASHSRPSSPDCHHFSARHDSRAASGLQDQRARRQSCDKSPLAHAHDEGKLVANHMCQYCRRRGEEFCSSTAFAFPPRLGGKGGPKTSSHQGPRECHMEGPPPPGAPMPLTLSRATVGS